MKVKVVVKKKSSQVSVDKQTTPDPTADLSTAPDNRENDKATRFMRKRMETAFAAPRRYLFPVGIQK